MAYSDITIDDPNPVKRWLQRRRFKTAMDLYGKHDSPLTVLDFGAGNGHLCLELAKIHSDARFLCYEPSPTMRMEAEENIGTHPRIEVIDSLTNVDANSIDVTFSLEVFEHLPERETEDALHKILSLTKPAGRIVFGVPNEIYGAALYKGVFRMFRRYGDFDASPMNILNSVIGSPPKNRPTEILDSDLRYHFHHMGFDHRKFRRRLFERKVIPIMVSSPFECLGSALSPEIYYVVQCGEP